MSTDLEPVAEVLQPLTGEMIPVRDIGRVARALAELRAHRERVAEALDAFTAAVVDESRRQGSRTLNVGDTVLTVSADSEIEWDVEVLDELRSLGLPEDRFDQLVTAVVSDGALVNVAAGALVPSAGGALVSPGRPSWDRSTARIG